MQALELNEVDGASQKEMGEKKNDPRRNMVS
jgi:hypothetical protein